MNPAPIQTDQPDPLADEKAVRVIGLSAAGRDQLNAEARSAIARADLLVGGKRHLGYFPDFSGHTVAITHDMAHIGARLQQAVNKGERAVVLASGDPLWYGIGSTLLRYLPAHVLHFEPSPTAFQHAFAALGEPWHDAALLSAHARPLGAVIDGVLNAGKAAILTDNQQTPAVVAQALRRVGLPGDSPCAVCENLGGSDQRIVRATLDEISDQSFASLNVLIVWNRAGSALTPDRDRAPLDDDQFETRRRQITKREIRLLALAELALQPRQVLWDIGAGSGSISIEAIRGQPTASAYAVERRDEFCRHIDTNVRRHAVRNVHLVRGEAPAICAVLPDPDAIFVGGSGGNLVEILDVATARLRHGGRLVVNLAIQENLSIVRRALPDARVNQIQINRGRSIQTKLRFEALNPIYMVTWQNR